MMLENLGMEDIATKIRNAVDAVLEEAKVLTPDLHGNAIYASLSRCYHCTFIDKSVFMI